MADYSDVQVYPLNSMHLDGDALVSRATGRGDKVIELAPQASSNGWKHLPQLGGGYLVEASTKGKRVRMVVSCLGARGPREPVEFIVRWSL